jgi:hypothetical protein
MTERSSTNAPPMASIHSMYFRRRDLLHWFIRGGLKVTARTDSPNLEMASADLLPQDQSDG